MQKYAKSKELKNEIILETQYQCFQISYVITNEKIFYNEKNSLLNLDSDVFLFLFSLNHKKVTYKKSEEKPDLKKLRQYVYTQTSKSLYLMGSYLLLEKSPFISSQCIDTDNIFSNTIVSILKDLPVEI